MKRYDKLYDYFVSYIVYGAQGRQERSTIVRSQFKVINKKRIESMYPLLQGSEKIDALVIVTIKRLGK